MRRLSLIFAGAPAGLATGLLAWMLAGGSQVAAERLDGLQVQVSNLKAPTRSAGALSSVNVSDLASQPLFALTVGPGAVREPSIRVEGVSISRGRTAALLAIDGQPPEWLTLGASRAGVALQSVTAGAVVVETVTGPRELALGTQSGSDAGALPKAEVAPVGSAPDQIPPGFRSPPPPASAPGTP